MRAARALPEAYRAICRYALWGRAGRASSSLSPRLEKEDSIPWGKVETNMLHVYRCSNVASRWHVRAFKVQILGGGAQDHLRDFRRGGHPGQRTAATEVHAAAASVLTNVDTPPFHPIARTSCGDTLRIGSLTRGTASRNIRVQSKPLPNAPITVCQIPCLIPFSYLLLDLIENGGLGKA